MYICANKHMHMYMYMYKYGRPCTVPCTEGYMQVNKNISVSCRSRLWVGGKWGWVEGSEHPLRDWN